MPSPKVIFKSNSLNQLMDLKSRDFNNASDVKNELASAVLMAKNIMSDFEDYIDNISRGTKKKKIIARWNNDSLMKKYFGKKKINKSEAKFITRKFGIIHNYCLWIFIFYFNFSNFNFINNK